MFCFFLVFLLLLLLLLLLVEFGLFQVVPEIKHLVYVRVFGRENQRGNNRQAL